MLHAECCVAASRLRAYFMTALRSLKKIFETRPPHPEGIRFLGFVARSVARHQAVHLSLVQHASAVLLE